MQSALYDLHNTSLLACSLAGRYDNSFLTRFLSPIDVRKFQHRYSGVTLENYGDLCSAMPALNSLPNQYKLPKEGTLHYMKGDYILNFYQKWSILVTQVYQVCSISDEN
jgi:hypothetical protein